MGAGAGHRAQYTNFVWNSERWKGFTFRDGDIVISTPPKCGTTWMQMQCAVLLFRTADLPAPLSRLSPWLDMNTRPVDEVLTDLEGQTHRRFIKTHTPLGGLPWDERVTYVHVARDPRDVALSWDNHMSNMDMGRLFELRASAVGIDDLADLGLDGPPEPPPDDPAERFWYFIEGDGSTDAQSRLESLVHHCGTFWERREAFNVHLFHYSDLRADLPGQMARLAAALGVDPPTDELVDAARFENMKARATELVPNSEAGFWVSSDRFFDKARSGDWQSLIGDDLPRYEAALRALTDDEALIAWLHAGWLG